MVIDKDLYPFAGRVLDLDRLRYHYLDEGHTDRDEAVVMVHGNPTWSCYYRELVKALRGVHRGVVPDRGRLLPRRGREPDERRVSGVRRGYGVGGVDRHRRVL